MPRTYLTFGDIEGKLEVLRRVECTRCGRRRDQEIRTDEMRALVESEWPDLVNKLPPMRPE